MRNKLEQLRSIIFSPSLFVMLCCDFSYDLVIQINEGILLSFFSLFSPSNVGGLLFFFFLEPIVTMDGEIGEDVQSFLFLPNPSIQTDCKC